MPEGRGLIGPLLGSIDRFWERRERWVVGLVAIAAAVVHAASREPRFLLADDLATVHLPFLRYTYAHPFDAVRGIPAPPSMFGTQTVMPGSTQDVVPPFVHAVLSLFAPRDLLELAAFEWHVTSVYVALAIVGAVAVLRWLGVSRPLALAVGGFYPFFVTIGAEYTLIHLHRAKLLLPLAMLVTMWGWRKRSLVRGFAVGCAWAFCLGHSWLAFWIPAMLASWAVAYAWCRRAVGGDSARPTAGDLRFAAVAALVVVVALARPFLAFRGALAASAWTARLASSGALQIGYLTQGAEWLPSAGAASAVPSTAAPGGGINVAVAAGLSLLAAMALVRVANLRKATVARSSPALGAPAAASLVAAFAAIPLLALERLPASAYGSAGARAFAFGVPLPLTLVSLGHVADRTWMAMFEVSGTVGAVIVLSRWSTAPRSARRRVVEIVVAALLYFVVLRLLGWRESRLASGDALLAAEVVVVVLALVALTGVSRPGPRAAAAIALPLVAFGFAMVRWPIFLEQRATGSRGRSVGEIFARVEAAPAETKGRSDYRLAVVGDPTRIVLYLNVAMLFESGGTTTYDMHTARRSTLAWLESLRAIDLRLMPYSASIDYARLDRLGLLPLLGIRWWLATEIAKRPAFLSPEAREISPGLYEDPRALPKARALRRVYAAVDRERDLERVLEIGARGAIATEGVVQASLLPASLGDEDRATVETIDVRAGSIVLATRGTKPFVIATTELSRPGWSVAVDDSAYSAAVIAEIDGGFVGTVAPAGEHRVALRLRIAD